MEWNRVVEMEVMVFGLVGNSRHKGMLLVCELGMNEFLN